MKSIKKALFPWIYLAVSSDLSFQGLMPTQQRCSKVRIL